MQVELFIPHRQPMLLLDDVLSVDEQRAVCQSKITQDHLFFDPEIQGVYSWIGIEMMAQACGVLARVQGRRSLDEKPRLGFLLSVRNFKAEKPYFTIDTILTIMAQKVYIDSSLGSFDCQIKSGQSILATASINALEPTDEILSQILQGS